jgi:hypothetical protein
LRRRLRGENQVAADAVAKPLAIYFIARVANKAFPRIPFIVDKPVGFATE